MENDTRERPRRALNLGRIVQPAIGALVVLVILWRLWTVIFAQQLYSSDTWFRFAISGVILGSVYALIALGYTLVYGILFMINFAHGDVMMLGAFAGYFVLEAFHASGVLTQGLGWAIGAVVVTFVVGMTVGAVVAVILERVAYRPLRQAPRLVPLISAIGASLFLQNFAQQVFGAARHTYANPVFIQRNAGWNIAIGGQQVLVTYTGVLTLVLSTVLMIGLYVLVQRTKIGRAMRAVAEDKDVAALMGVDVDRVISNTFLISGVLAGAAGVMWGFHMGIVYHYVGFIPGMKAFTAAVMGGIGNIPGAMLGGLSLGVMEALGPAALGLPFQLKDVLAFSILVLVLIFRPTGLLGEVLSEEKM